MGQTSKVLVVIGAVLVTVMSAASVGAQNALLVEQINQHERRLTLARKSHLTREEGTELITLGYLYRQAGRLQKALECLNAALPIEQESHNRPGQAMTLNTMGRVYTDLGQEEKALGLFDQALAVWRAMGIRPGEANTLNNIGHAYDNLGRRPEALKALNEALSLWHAIDETQHEGHRTARQEAAIARLSEALPSLRDMNGRAGEASTLDNLGKTYADMGRDKESLGYFNQALAIWRDEDQRAGEALTLTNLGRAYADLGRKQDSLDVYNQALSIWRTMGSRQGEALTVNSVGRLYRDLGQHETALDYYRQALGMWREVGNRNGEGLALMDIGRAYADLGQGKAALEYFDQALPIWRETGARRGEAATLNNSGRVWSDLGQPAKALEVDLRALVLWREVEDRRGEALALATIGWAYAAQKETDKALASELAGLALAKAVGDPEVEGGIEAVLMNGFRDLQRREEAILFGKAAVNSYQQIRQNISGMDKDLQSGFVRSKSSTYRTLAELLVQADRLGEAEQVLDLLKEQELKEVVRGASDGSAANVELVKLNAVQQKAQASLAVPEKTAVALTDLSVERARLSAKTDQTPDDAARLKTLDAKIEATNAEVSDFFRRTLYPELAQRAGTQDANALLSREKSEVSRLQSTLASLGPHVVGIRLLLGDAHAYAIVVTAQARKKFELTATPEALRNKVLEVRNDLRTPTSDPRPHLAELYAMTVAPFGDELSALEHDVQPQGRVPTLLWSLDGAMRYVPMAALYDGQHYLAERFNNVLFTPESYGHMTAPTAAGNAALRVLAMGLSKSYGGLPALPGVLPELHAVAHDPAVPESHGPMDGVLLPDDRFTYAALKTQLAAGSTFPVVHIASHFVLDSGSGKEPYLMLGGETAGDPGGYQLTLSKLDDSTITFRGTRLLTLSACSTAKGDVAADGLEMDSLGMVAQQKDAEAVLATLWDVNDASTSRMMRDFYAAWVKNPAAGKAEALRQTQLAFVRGRAESPQPDTGRGVQPVDDAKGAPRQAGYSHPYYWAPFVLVGNYR